MTGSGVPSSVPPGTTGAAAKGTDSEETAVSGALGVLYRIRQSSTTSSYTVEKTVQAVVQAGTFRVARNETRSPRLDETCEDYFWLNYYAK